MSSTVEQIKERLSIAEVVQEYLELTRAGGRFRARCPFHNERTPSFYVSPERNSFYCFGCSKGGDIFTFVQEIEGVDFKEALALLAARAGVEIAYDRGAKEERSQRERLREAINHAVLFYHNRLHEHPEVVAYLSRRGVTNDTVKAFRLGYAPAQWHTLADHLTQKGFTADEMIAAGLVIKKEGSDRRYDRFRNRIMFPIADQTGNPIAFSGRIYDELPGTDLSQGKYINNPQTLLYDKSSALFGFDRAKQAIRTRNTCVVVEGQMDVIISHQSGVTNTVAVSGTALTESHIRTIGRLARSIVFAFDGDEAGIRATERAVMFALSEDCAVRIAVLPDGKDPADMASEDGEAWKSAVDSAVHIIDFLSQTVLNRATDVRAKRLLAKERILPYIARLKSSIEQAHFVASLSAALGVGEEPIWADLRVLKGDTQQKREVVPVRETPRRSRRATIIRHIIGLRSLISTTEYDANVSGVLGHQTWEELLASFAPEKDALMFELEKRYPKEHWHREIGALIGELKIETLRETLDETLAKLRMCEKQGDTAEIETLLARSQELLQQINELKTNRT